MLVKDPVRLPSQPWSTLVRGEGPLLATSIHAGHDVRPEVAHLLAIEPEARRREEDPYTDLWTDIVDTRLQVHRSRFEVDLNRPRADAIYLSPAQSWGLRVWRRPPPADLIARSLAIYDSFYDTLRTLFTDLHRRHRRFVVLDLHSYNHRRGSGREADDPAEAPDINLGTGSMPQDPWAPIVHAFAEALGEVPVQGRRLDVRENVRFQGGHLARWTHRTYPGVGCVLAVECKKFFMDEWTGEPDPDAILDLFRALQAGADAVRGLLSR